jgi:hypothetical protein
MNTEHHITEIIRLTSIVSVGFPLLVYLSKLKKASRPVHLIGALMIISALSDFIAFVLSSKGKSTVMVFNTYYILLFLILAWFYYEILLTPKRRTPIVTGLFIYATAFVLITFYVQPFMSYQTLMWTITGVMMIIFSIAYFLYLFSGPTTLRNYELLWVNSGVLLYFSLNLFLFVIGSHILTKLDPEISLLIWSFHNVNNIMKNILFGFGIYAFSREAVSVNPQTLSFLKNS